MEFSQQLLHIVIFIPSVNKKCVKNLETVCHIRKETASVAYVRTLAEGHNITNRDRKVLKQNISMMTVVRKNCH